MKREMMKQNAKAKTTRQESSSLDCTDPESWALAIRSLNKKRMEQLDVLLANAQSASNLAQQAAADIKSMQQLLQDDAEMMMRSWNSHGNEPPRVPVRHNVVNLLRMP